MSNLKQELKDLEIEFKIQEREFLMDGVLDEIDKALLKKYRAKIYQLRSKLDQQEGIPSKAHAEGLDVIDKLKKVQKRIANLHFKLKKALAKVTDENPPGEAVKKEMEDMKKLIAKFNKQLGWVAMVNRKDLKTETKGVKMAEAFQAKAAEQLAKFLGEKGSEIATETKAMLLQKIKEQKIVIPLTIKEKKFEVKSIKAKLSSDIKVIIAPEFDVQGSINMSFEGLEEVLGVEPPIGTEIKYDFTKNKGQFSIGVGPVSLEFKEEEKYSEITITANILETILAPAKALLSKGTLNALSLTSVGKVWCTIRMDEKGVRVVHKEGNIKLGLHFNPKAVAKFSDNEKLFDKDGDGKRDEMSEEEEKAIYEKINEDTESDLMAGAEIEFNVKTEAGESKDGLEVTTADGKVRAYIQIGSFKKEITIEDEGKAIGSKEERRALELACLVSAMKDALSSLPASLDSVEDRMKAARAANGAFRKAHAAYRAKAEQQFKPEEGKDPVNVSLPGLYKTINSIFDIYGNGVGIAQSNTIFPAIKKAGLFGKVKLVTKHSEEAMQPIKGTINIEYNYDDGSFDFANGNISGIDDEKRMALRTYSNNDAVAGFPMAIRLKIDTRVFGAMIIATRGAAPGGKFKFVSPGKETKEDAIKIVKAFNGKNPLRNLKIGRIL
jgi:hypothetical protein